MSNSVILCATDLTQASQQTVDYAIAFAQLLGSSVELVYVIDDQDIVAPSSIEGSDLQQHLQTHLEGQAEVFTQALEAQRQRCEAAGVACKAEMTHGRPWRKLVELADQQNADLVVIGAHREFPGAETEWPQRMLGTTTERVVRAVECSVFVVKGSASIPKGLAGLKWLVGIDFSDSAQAALELARTWVKKSGGELQVGHVVIPAGGEEKSDEERTWKQLLRDQTKQDAEKKLVAYLKEHAPEAVPQQIVSPDIPAHALSEAASFLEADVLVIGAHSESMLGRWLLGSNAEHCLRASSVPVLVVPTR